MDELALNTTPGPLPEGSTPDVETLLVDPSSENVSPQSEETMLVIGHGITIGEAIGEGGMARVCRGEQQSLHRDVAVKAVYAPEHRENLLREAYVTAAVDHPNIVPIYDLVFDHDGTPMMVLKRIEGESWFDAMTDPKLKSDDGPDLIEWNIRIAIHVSRALSLAHTRGIAHLDVKPSNIMLGPFGEVYLLDWGLAGSFHPDEGFLPRVMNQRAGTPGYMSPEQWNVSVDEVGPWTDVYLLAASLFHALTGATPWRTASDTERVAQTGERPLPWGLQAILERAMALDCSQRTPSAAVFRQELESYLRRRGSVQIGERAAELAQEAFDALQAGDVATSENAAAQAAAVFSAALTQWSGNQAAIEGQLRLARSRIEDALSRDQPEVAQRILATLADPPEALQRTVEQALSHAASDASEVRALRRDQDLRVGMDLRIVVMLLCGPLWVGGWVIAAVTESLGVALSLLVVGTVSWAGGLLALGQELLSNRLNRVVVLNILCALCAVIAVMVTGYARGDTLLSLAPFFLILHACCLALIAVVFDARLSALAGIWVLLFGLSLRWPNAGLWLVAGGNSAVVLGTLWVNVRLRQAQKEAGSAPRV